jgi:hypothetical protein
MTLSALGIFSAAGAGGAVAGDYELIQTQILTSSEASVTFSNLGNFASTYKHLQIRAVVRSSSSFDNFFMRFNSDTGSNYAHHRLIGNGSTVTSTGSSSQTSMAVGVLSDSGTANVFSPNVIDILDAYSTTKNKTFRSLYGDTVSPTIRLNSGFWINTASLTTINFTAGALNFATGSRFSLYGIRG